MQKKWSRDIPFLPFHPECQLQVPPLAPWNLQLLAHPKDTNIHVLVLSVAWCWSRDTHVDTAGSQLNYLLSRGSILPGQAWQTRHSCWSWFTLRTGSWICVSLRVENVSAVEIWVVAVLTHLSSSVSSSSLSWGTNFTRQTLIPLWDTMTKSF